MFGVDLSDVVSPYGKYLIKPTALLTNTRGTISGYNVRTFATSASLYFLFLSLSTALSVRRPHKAQCRNARTVQPLLSLSLF